MVAASRAFVCIRPQTYESASEAEVLKWVFSDRSGDLRNTSFGMLSSDGKRLLSRSGRSPSMVYQTPEHFVAALEELAEDHDLGQKDAIEALPALPDLRVALSVAAADLRPLVALYETEARKLAKLQAELSKQAWSDAFTGRFRYVVIDSVEGFEELKLQPGISVIQSESYGRGGVILSHVDSPKSAKHLSKVLAKGLQEHDVEARNVRDHIRTGVRNDIEWETAIPTKGS